MQARRDGSTDFEKFQNWLQDRLNLAGFFDWILIFDTKLRKKYHNLSVPEIFKDLGEKKEEPRQIFYVVSLVGELAMMDEFQHKQVGLEPYTSEDLHQLCINISKRMDDYATSPFWECAGLSAEEYIAKLKEIRGAMALHPTNFLKAYKSLVKKARSWQDLIIYTYYFSILRAHANNFFSQSKIRSYIYNRAGGLVKI